MSYKLTIPQPATLTDMSFQDYNKRQLLEISAGRNREQALNAKPAGNFTYNGSDWQQQPYEGFAIVCMVSENEENGPLAERLIEIQKELKYNLSPACGFYRLPPESFHQTIANTLSGDRFKEHIVGAGLEDAYPEIINNAFNQIPVTENALPIRMKMAGLSIFGTAIGILGIFENEDDYNRITGFRAGFYNDEQLAQLDVKMTRPFIGHITLAYIEQNLTKNQKDHLAGVIIEINETLAEEDNYFFISGAGLRRYHHLAEFIKQENYPVYQF
jgi:hypothetical protein